jgi:hypothetical protein
VSLARCCTAKPLDTQAGLDSVNKKLKISIAPELSLTYGGRLQILIVAAADPGVMPQKLSGLRWVNSYFFEQFTRGTTHRATVRRFLAVMDIPAYDTTPGFHAKPFHLKIHLDAAGGPAHFTVLWPVLRVRQAQRTIA